jgi:hypothetical protein
LTRTASRLREGTTRKGADSQNTSREGRGQSGHDAERRVLIDYAQAGLLISGNLEANQLFDIDEYFSDVFHFTTVS